MDEVITIPLTADLQKIISSALSFILPELKAIINDNQFQSLYAMRSLVNYQTIIDEVCSKDKKSFRIKGLPIEFVGIGIEVVNDTATNNVSKSLKIQINLKLNNQVFTCCAAMTVNALYQRIASSKFGIVVSEKNK